MCMTDEQKYAYLAGIIDGEGSLLLNPYRGMWRPDVTVATTDRELAEWLKENFGGSISNKKVYESYHRPSFAWSVCNQKALAVILLARPYMQIERKQRRADLLLYDYSEYTPRNGKYTPEMLKKKKDLVEFFHSI